MKALIPGKFRPYFNFINTIFVAALCLMAVRCAPSVRHTRDAKRTPVQERKKTPVSRRGKTFYGEASYYGPGFHGRKTASGERFNMYGLTAAHKTLPFNTRVKVTNLNNGKSVIVRINDRGPYKKGRIIDLSVGAAKRIGLIGPGVARVKVVILK